MQVDRTCRTFWSSSSASRRPLRRYRMILFQYMPSIKSQIGIEPIEAASKDDRNHSRKCSWSSKFSENKRAVNPTLEIDVSMLLTTDGYPQARTHMSASLSSPRTWGQQIPLQQIAGHSSSILGPISPLTQQPKHRWCLFV